MRTYKTVEDFLTAHEDNRTLHIHDDGIAEGETEYLFKVEGETEVFCLLTTYWDICAADFDAGCKFIEDNGGVVYECSEWHNGSQDKTGYIVYQHPCEVFRASVEDHL